MRKYMILMSYRPQMVTKKGKIKFGKWTQWRALQEISLPFRSIAIGYNPRGKWGDPSLAHRFQTIEAAEKEITKAKLTTGAPQRYKIQKCY